MLSPVPYRDLRREQSRGEKLAEHCSPPNGEKAEPCVVSAGQIVGPAHMTGNVFGKMRFGGPTASPLPHDIRRLLPGHSQAKHRQQVW